MANKPLEYCAQVQYHFVLTRALFVEVRLIIPKLPAAEIRKAAVKEKLKCLTLH
jgi:hypothetical protein